MLTAIKKEIIMRRDYLQGEALDTLYLGGGTPSVLSARQLASLLRVIREHYAFGKDPEITMEANPDDLTPDFAQDVLELGINRLSIGIQSFHEEDLRFMNRRHGSSQSHRCLEIVRKAGCRNLSLDLIYGIPGMTLGRWAENLDIATGYSPEHIAAYHLTYEKGTVMDYRRKKGKFQVQAEEMSRDQYHLLVDRLRAAEYMHYEISNFAFPGYLSRHNSAYWKDEKYLGAGPSAHSYNGYTRRWNIARNASYMKLVQAEALYYETEELDNQSRYHDYIMTRLRTMWGIDLDYIRNEFGRARHDYCLQQAMPYLLTGRMQKEGNRLYLSEEGMFIADRMIESLFQVRE
jgi:oxygen-independent coproporphyrinogen-3 oxidase